MTNVFIILILFSFLNCIRDSENRDEKENRNLKNNYSTFIYNMIPENSNAQVSAEYSKAMNTFSINLLREVYNTENFSNKNLVLSPFSISRNLAVLTEGTTGASKQELLDVLGGQVALDDAKNALAQLLYADKSIVFQCADAFWINSNSFSIKTAFRDKIADKYGVETIGLDFNDASGTAKTINNWISKNTNKYINNVLKENDITPQTAAYLTNAVYFEADWTSPFDISKTSNYPFSAPDGSVEVDMMISRCYHETYITDQYKNAKLYYGTNNINFFYLDIYMPTTITCKEFISKHSLTALANKDTKLIGSLKMPKFFFTTKIGLIPTLKQLGINRIFNPLKSEITEMVDGRLFVSQINHQAGIKTDEEGTKAFAVTITKMKDIAAAGDPSPDVVLDNPFVYFIRAGENGLVLFAGVVNNPNEK